MYIKKNYRSVHMLAGQKDIEREIEKASSMRDGHATIPTPPFLPYFGILGMNAHVPVVFSKHLGLGLELYN